MHAPPGWSRSGWEHKHRALALALSSSLRLRSVLHATVLRQSPVPLSERRGLLHTSQEAGGVSGTGEGIMRHAPKQPGAPLDMW